MTTRKDYHWTGTSKWAKVHRPETDPWGNTKYSMCFYPESDKIRKEMTKVLVRNKMKEDDDGFFFNLRAPEDQPPRVVNRDGDTITDLVGNGSNVTVKVRVESFPSQQYGEIVKATLLAVRVNELVEYNPDATNDESDVSDDTGSAIGDDDSSSEDFPDFPDD